MKKLTWITSEHCNFDTVYTDQQNEVEGERNQIEILTLGNKFLDYWELNRMREF